MVNSPFWSVKNGTDVSIKPMSSTRKTIILGAVTSWGPILQENNDNTKNERTTKNILGIDFFMILIICPWKIVIIFSDITVNHSKAYSLHCYALSILPPIPHTQFIMHIKYCSKWCKPSSQCGDWKMLCEVPNCWWSSCQYRKSRNYLSHILALILMPKQRILR